MGDAMKFRVVNTGSVIRALRRWISKYGKPSVIVTDNAAYYTSAEMEEWCLANSVEQRFIAPYRHESVGLVERYHRTLIDRIRKLSSSMEDPGWMI